MYYVLLSRAGVSTRVSLEMILEMILGMIRRLRGGVRCDRVGEWRMGASERGRSSESMRGWTVLMAGLAVLRKEYSDHKPTDLWLLAHLDKEPTLKNQFFQRRWQKKEAHEKAF